MRPPIRLFLMLLATTALMSSALLAETKPAAEKPPVPPAPPAAPPMPAPPAMPALPAMPASPAAPSHAALPAMAPPAPPAPLLMAAIPALPEAAAQHTPTAAPLPGHASAAPAPEEPPAPPRPPAAPTPAGAPRAPEAPRTPEPRGNERTQLFQVAMVVGTTSATADLDGDGQADPASGTGLDSLPRSVRQALVDLGDFIPYKRYMLLDTVLIRTARDGVATMRGPGGREFRVELKLFPSRGEEDPDLIVHRFEVIDVTRTPVRKTEVGGPGGFKQTEETPPSAPKTIIATSFGMSIGETLVVGSSRLNGGDTALILLVTAPR